MSYHQTIYDRLRAAGITEAGALGILGNWECESNCEPVRVQGDFQPSRRYSKEYTALADSGQMTADEFAKDQKGYGLAQWTFHTRKRNLWNRAKQTGDSIGDIKVQIDFALWELQNENKALYEYLRQAEAIWDSCERVCKEYERPAVNNIQARYEAALRIKQELDTSAEPVTEPVTDEPEPPGWATLPAWHPQTLKYGDKGVEVRLLQDLLCCRDFYCTPDGIFGKDTEKKLKAFQTATGLDPDGSCGPATWTALCWR